MIYSDLIFMFAFLPLFVIVSFLLKETWSRNLAAVIASLIFVTWGRQWYYALIILPVFLIYICGIAMRRRHMPLLGVLGALAGGIYAVLAAIGAAAGGTAAEAICSVGFIAFGLRGASYLNELSDGERSEKSFLNLAVYLMSFEFMLFPLMLKYSQLKESLNNRRPSLAKMSAGLGALARGFAVSAVLGGAFESVRLSVYAAPSGAMPWINAITAVLISAAELYIYASGIQEMSYGLALINGFSVFPPTPTFVPHLRISDHLGEFCETLPGFVYNLVSGYSSEGKAAIFAALSLCAGALIGSGAGAASFFIIMILATAIESVSDKKAAASDVAFSIVMILLAVFGLMAGHITDLARAITETYDYDITYYLNAEFIRSLPWLVIGLIIVSPLRRIAASSVRRSMSSGAGAYSVARVAGTVISAALIVLGVVAEASR